MFLDYLYTASNSTGGLDDILVDTVGEIPELTGLILLFTFFVVLLGGIGRQKMRTGTADYSMWTVIASISTFLVSLIMSTVTGLIELDILAIVISITIFSGVWFFLDRKPSEV